MSASDGGRGPFRKRRRSNIDGARSTIKVTVSEVERAALYRLESETGRSAQTIMLSAALDGSGESTVDRRALAAELMMARQQLAAVGNNLNQLARHANATSEFPMEAELMTNEIRDQLRTIRQTLDKLE
ncbi:plasmid mobilization relaxosome protein MobC [Kocuria sp. HSID16901]|uniref:plasmid mobilization relaxosome protein MobC n=1 Tax=Kocuria sp. HSID16901 TaxID=2419505 RepID=UPI001386DF94|nr:plasmid mobilization relaxosome protein MobC [Kocuria sp. HSID16901]